MSAINFHDQSAGFVPANSNTLELWLHHIASREKYQIEKLNYIFCSDEDLLLVNKQYLNHDYFTDIITFGLSEKEDTVSADIYISIDRIKDNANSMSHDFQQELLRVLAHGLLHLIGYNDKTKSEQEVMTKMENDCITDYTNFL